jgi:cell division protein FtsL
VEMANKLVFVLIFLILMVASLAFFIIYQQINYTITSKSFKDFKKPIEKNETKNEIKSQTKQEKKENWVISFGLYGNDPRVRKFPTFNIVHLWSNQKR